MPSEVKICPVMCVRKLSFRQMRGRVQRCAPRSGWIQADVSAQPCSDALLHCWSFLQRPRQRGSPSSILRLPVVVTLTFQELGPVGFLPPCTLRTCGGKGGSPWGCYWCLELAFRVLAPPPPLGQGARDTFTEGQTGVWRLLSQEGKPQWGEAQIKIPSLQSLSAHTPRYIHCEAHRVA